MNVYDFLGGRPWDKQQYITFWDSSGGVGGGLNSMSAFYAVSGKKVNHYKQCAIEISNLNAS